MEWDGLLKVDANRWPTRSSSGSTSNGRRCRTAQRLPRPSTTADDDGERWRATSTTGGCHRQ